MLNKAKVGSMGGTPPMDREEEAELALKNTHLTRAMGISLCLFFLLTIYGVPALQQGIEFRQNLAARRSEAEPASTPLLPQAFEVFSLLPARQQVMAVRSLADAWALLPGVKGIKDFENTLEQQSFLSQALLPHTQLALTSLLGAGNEQAYCGLESWLFYRPDVDCLTAPPFLQTSVLRDRARSGDSSSVPVQPDPIQAIVRFKEQLAARGIDLVVLPMPVKPTIEPYHLSRRYNQAAEPVRNPSFAHFRQALEKQGILVYDPSDSLVQARMQTCTPQYLQTDTHWTPAAMELEAHQLASLLQAHQKLPSLSPARYTRTSTQVTSLGDIAVMLKLPQNQQLYNPQQVTIHPVYAPGGRPWKPDRHADILLLGDSFSNIYSLGGMGWGHGAGFAEQLSFNLQRPLDRIVVNAGGAYTSRQQLVQELKRGRDRLAGKRLVIYEFAFRDLSFGDWKILDLPERKVGS